MEPAGVAMEVVEHEGLRVGYVEAEEALAERWLDRSPDLDVIRVSRPAPTLWPDLEAEGFSIKPAWLTWLRQLPESDEEFLRALPRDAHRSFQEGWEYCRSSGVDLELHVSPSPATLERFLGIYQQVIASMERGILFATSKREALLARLPETLIILATRGNELLGGSLCEIRHAESMLYIRYHVATGQARKNGLMWAAYLRAFQFARSEGLRILSMGSDPNLYGHVSRTGLFYVKHRLGFRPLPSQLVTSGSDEADLVLRLGVLADPSLIVCYAPHRPPDRIQLSGRWLDVPALRADLFCHQPPASQKMFQAGFVTDLRIRSTEPARGLQWTGA